MAAKSPRASVELLAEERPRFPEGLRVLLLESASSSSHTHRLLRGLKYEVMAVEDLQGATAALRRNSTTSAFDVVLADAALLGSVQQQLFGAAASLPVVLMGHDSSPAQVLQAVEHGAADFLHRPLSEGKLRNLWQHTVRMIMSSDSSCQSSPRAAPAAASLAPHSPPSAADALAGETPGEHPLELECKPLMDEFCEASARGPGCLEGLELPPLLPSQLTFDPESIFLDLGCPVPPNEPSLDDILQPCTHADDSMTATADFAQLGDCSTDQHGCSSGAGMYSKADLESCADTTSCFPGLTSPIGNSSTAGLHSHASFTGITSYSGERCGSQGPAAATMGTAAGVAAMTAGPSSNSACVPPGACIPQMAMGSGMNHFWGAAMGLDHGMVWGMPLLNVAKVPGLVVPPISAAEVGAAAGGSQPAGRLADSSTRSGGSGTAARAPNAVEGTAAVSAAGVPAAGVPVAGVPPVMPPTCWPMMPMMMAGSAAGAAGYMSFPCMSGMPGMFPAMAGFMGVMTPMPLGMPMQTVPPVPLPGMPAPWPAAPAVAAAMPPTAAAPTAAAGQPIDSMPARKGDATARSGCSDLGLGTAAVGVAGTCCAGSIASNKSACSGLLCTDSLFVSGPIDEVVC